MARTRYLSELRQDVGYAARVLRRTPGFAAVAVLTLALGIGGSTAMFTLVDSVLLRPLRFAEPDRLTMLWARMSPTRCCARLSESYVHDWRLESTAFDDIAAWSDAIVNLTGDGPALEVRADRVTTNFFTVLGIAPVEGRTFTVDTQLRDVPPEVVLSYGFWQRKYGGRPDVIGRSIILDGEPRTIVGVMPAHFAIRTVELAESRAEVWIPTALVAGDRTGMGGTHFAVGRLAPGVTIEQAHAQLMVIAGRIEQAHPSHSSNWDVGVVSLIDATVKDVRLVLLLLFGAVSLLLLMTCANVATLVLNRAATRQTELAIRLSLGATGQRLARQLFVESLVLAAVGGVLGVLFAEWSTGLLVSVIPAGLQLPRTREIGIDLRVLAFACLVTVLTAVVFGLVPLLTRARCALDVALRQSARGASSGPRRSLLNGTLTMIEVALAVVLLSGAALLGRSFWALTRVDPGFNAQQVLTMRTTLPASTYDNDEGMRGFARQLLERIGQLRDVQAAGTVNYLPMSNYGAAALFEIEGRPLASPGARPASWVSVVGGRYFEAMGIPLLRGRLPSDLDSERTGPVFVIDEALARQEWGTDDPVGARLTWRQEDETITGEIVGIVGNVRWGGMAANPNGTTYFWFPQGPTRELTVVVRTGGDPAATATQIAAQVPAIDPNQPVGEIRPMRDLVADDLAQPRFTMVLLLGFAATALLLAALGLYGVIASGVTARTREIGVRVALGAQRADVLRLVMHRALWLTGAGLVIGMAIALALGNVVASLLYGVTPTDPTTLVGVACVLISVAMLATYLPARRATRVDPMVALKND